MVSNATVHHVCQNIPFALPHSLESKPIFKTRPFCHVKLPGFFAVLDITKAYGEWIRHQLFLTPPKPIGCSLDNNVVQLGLFKVILKLGMFTENELYVSECIFIAGVETNFQNATILSCQTFGIFRGSRYRQGLWRVN